MEHKSSQLLMRLSKTDRQILEKLAEIWSTTLAEAVRRATRETLARELRRA